MNHFERVRAALRGEEVDCVPVSLWRHWPGADESAQGLAEAMVHWQRRFDFDLVKFMPTGTYGVHDWGAETAYSADARGTRRVTKPGVRRHGDWLNLAVLNPREGSLGQEVSAIGLAAAALADSVPILQTVFSPLTTAYKLAGNQLLADLREHPHALHAGLQIITATTVDFVRACLRAGAHGIFFASQNGSYQLHSEAEFQEFGERYDRQLLDAVTAACEFVMLHIHGEDIMFDRMAAYGANMINWHDRRVAPTLRQAITRCDALLVGGLDEQRLIVEGPVDAIRAQVQDAVAQTGGRRLLIAPGCVIPIDTPEAHIQAVVDTLRGGLAS